MPTSYPAILNHQPVTGADIEQIAAYLRTNRETILTSMASGGVVLEFDEVDPFFVRLQVILVKFAMTVNALPQRTLLELKGTVKQIARKPQDFLNNWESYDPEAVARVLDVCPKANGEKYSQQDAWEDDLNKLLTPQIVKDGALKVIEALQKECDDLSKKGHPELVLQTELAEQLGKLFVTCGGKLTRTVRAGSNEVDGPFRRFLDAVVPCVSKIALAADVPLTVATMVDKARKKLLVEKAA